MKVIAEFPLNVDVSLSSCPDRKEVLEQINKALTGKKEFALDEEVPEELVRVHRNVHMYHRKTIIVEVFEDGEMRIKR